MVEQMRLSQLGGDQRCLLRGSTQETDVSAPARADVLELTVGPAAGCADAPSHAVGHRT